ncbi:MAG: dipicolinate synthase subunit B [bacterium]
MQEDLLINKTIGYALTGSFCTFESTINQMKNLISKGVNIIPIFSFNSQSIDTRFGNSKDFILQIENLTGNKVIKTIEDAEPIGPKSYLDIMIVAPCSGNTLAKINAGICDTPVLMAVKAHIRTNKPVVLAVSTNDGLGANFKNIAEMMDKKNFYFVPFGQDDFINKPKSLVADFKQIPKSLTQALKNKQVQPLIIEYLK